MDNTPKLGGVAGGLLSVLKATGTGVLTILVGRSISTRAPLRVQACAGGFFWGWFAGIAAFHFLTDWGTRAEIGCGLIWGGASGVAAASALVLLFDKSSSEQPKTPRGA